MHKRNKQTRRHSSVLTTFQSRLFVGSFTNERARQTHGHTPRTTRSMDTATTRFFVFLWLAADPGRHRISLSEEGIVFAHDPQDLQQLASVR